MIDFLPIKCVDNKGVHTQAPLPHAQLASGSFVFSGKQPRRPSPRMFGEERQSQLFLEQEIWSSWAVCHTGRENGADVVMYSWEM